MTPKRIQITGASGSGTTTLGLALSQLLGWKQIDADDYYWLPTTPPFQEKRDSTERLKWIMKDLQSEQGAIATGSVIGWGRELEDAFDLIVYLHIPAEIRLQRLKDREIERHGEINPEFIEWASRFDEGDLTVRSRQLIEKWMGERQAQILRLEGDLSVEERVAVVLAQL
ncbi:MAG: AAA family ATPase [Cephaloticoccus sp.]|nr:AAA family ATPase [Cephaloticoccus sp.]MCF7758885.1 AAA family ATPase [Cephaloticoccus sp.]